MCIVHFRKEAPYGPDQHHPDKNRTARAKEHPPAAESRMMRDILLEISQRGTGKARPAERSADAPWSNAPSAHRRVQSVIRKSVDETGIVLYAGSDEVALRHYNYENIDDTDCLPPCAFAAPAGITTSP
ncbi:MAG: hypothetical protein ACLUFT_09905 [Gemmiger formicilis]|uniref:hypothetical protein n=1 Tax=Gemmiger formicilis TaxID=745368 RepID=UPI00399380CB